MNDFQKRASQRALRTIDKLEGILEGSQEQISEEIFRLGALQYYLHTPDHIDTIGANVKTLNEVQTGIEILFTQLRGILRQEYQYLLQGADIENWVLVNEEGIDAN